MKAGKNLKLRQGFMITVVFFIFVVFLALPVILFLLLSSILLFVPPIVTILFCFSWAALTVFSIFWVEKVRQLILAMKQPLEYCIGERATDTVPSDSSKGAIFERIKKMEQIEEVQLETSNKAVAPIALGKAKGATAIIVPPALFEELDDAEFETIVLHEVYHIKQDITENTFLTMDEILSYEPIDMYKVLKGILFLFSITSGAVVFYSSLTTATGISTFTVLFLIMALLFVLALPIGLSEIESGSSLIGSHMSEEYIYVRELFADSYSCLRSGKTKQLKQALRKCRKTALELNVFESLKGRKTSLLGFSSLLEAQDGKEIVLLRDIFHTNRKKLLHYIIPPPRLARFVHPSLKMRLLLVDKIDRLVNEHLTVFVMPERYNINSINRSLPRPVYNYLNEQKATFIAFLNYARCHNLSFNLRECSEELKTELFDTFLMVVGAVEMGLLDFSSQL